MLLYSSPSVSATHNSEVTYVLPNIHILSSYTLSRYRQKKSVKTYGHNFISIFILYLYLLTFIFPCSELSVYVACSQNSDFRLSSSWTLSRSFDLALNTTITYGRERRRKKTITFSIEVLNQCSSASLPDWNEHGDTHYVDHHTSVNDSDCTA